MIQSQTFTIMREPQAVAGAERITGARLAPIFRRAADASGWPVSLISAVAYLESWGDAQAASPAGPRGIMQFSEATARAAGLRVVRSTRFQVTTSHQLVRSAKQRSIRLSDRPPQNALHCDRSRRPLESRTRRNRRRTISGAPGDTSSADAIGPSSLITAAKAACRICLPLTEAAVHHKQPTVAEMFFAANPARHAELYQALQREMQRDYSPTYWFRIKRAEQLLALYQEDPAAFRELAEEYQNPIHPQRRAGDRLMVWLKSHDIFYRSPDDLRQAAGAEIWQESWTIRNSSDSRCRRWRRGPIGNFTCRTRRPPSELCCTSRLRRAGSLRS